MDGTPRLDDLIDLVRAEAPADDPIAQLRTAAALKSELDELTDALLGHFVDQARRAGASWSQIGEALGVTKQAVQQRHASTDSTARRLLASIAPKWLKESPTFLTRFTPRAKAVVVAAQEVARRFGHDHIGTEHLLLGLYDQPEGIAARILVEAGIPGDEVEAAVLERYPAKPSPAAGHLPFTSQSKKVLELALREALDLGHNYIGTEHQLLGILREGEGFGAELLAQRGLTHDDVRAAVILLLSSLK